MLKKAKDFQMPKKLQYDPKKISDTYGKFTAEPLERGFGTTLGIRCGGCCFLRWKDPRSRR